MAASRPATAQGKKMMKDHVKDDKKLLKERIKLEKKDLKNNQAHASDHTKGAKVNTKMIKKYSKALKTKGKSGSGSSSGSY